MKGGGGNKKTGPKKKKGAQGRGIRKLGGPRGENGTRGGKNVQRKKDKPLSATAPVTDEQKATKRKIIRKGKEKQNRKPKSRKEKNSVGGGGVGKEGRVNANDAKGETTRNRWMV